MAIKCKKRKADKMHKMFLRHREKWQLMRKMVNDHHASYDEKVQALRKFRRWGRDSSVARQGNVCWLCGRRRAVYTTFGVCRGSFRKLAASGAIPGLVKWSW